ncbi:MAG TPA: hypothetical protein VHW24_13145 [Bryobacteraceae bacterium]|jgi:hypothetical protein|nr:hypothetical protein [Bryobacteraceae bacterium]
MKTLVSTATTLALAAFLANAQTPNAVRDRGATPQASPGPIVTLTGTLVDAGCRNRSALNMSLPAVPFSAAAPAQTSAEIQAGSQMRAGQGYQNSSQPAQQQNPQVSASGVTVDSKTLASERSDVLEHQVPDLHARQMDPTCAITGNSHGFSLVLTDGRMLNLDDGGDSYATVAIQGSTAGRAMLNGNGGGIKPQAAIKGRIRDDQILVQSLKLTK